MLYDYLVTVGDSIAYNNQKAERQFAKQRETIDRISKQKRVLVKRTITFTEAETPTSRRSLCVAHKRYDSIHLNNLLHGIYTQIFSFLDVASANAGVF